MNAHGTLYLVVGPSGAGKDLCLDGASEALKDDPNWVFPKRYITRAAEAGGEEHLPITEDDFRKRQAKGAFALSWHAHNLDYAIPRSINDDLALGQNVIVNVSRQVLEDARKTYPSVIILLVTAPKEILRDRLIARGRETPEDIDERLSRSFQDMPHGPDVRLVINDGTKVDAVNRFLKALGAS